MVKIITGLVLLSLLSCNEGETDSERFIRQQKESFTSDSLLIERQAAEKMAEIEAKR